MQAVLCQAGLTYRLLQEDKIERKITQRKKNFTKVSPYNFYQSIL